MSTARPRSPPEVPARTERFALNDVRIQSDADGPSPARLVALSGPDKGNVYPLPAEGTFGLGRAEDNDVLLRDPEASRHHCTIIVAGDEIVVRDNRSTNGTFVGRKQVDRSVLQDGARLRIGQTRFAVVFGDDTRPARAVGVVAASAAARREVVAHKPARESVSSPGPPRPQPAPGDAPVPPEPLAPAEPGRLRRAGLALRRFAVRLAIRAAVLALVVGVVAGAWYGSDIREFAFARLGVDREVRIATQPPGAEVFVDNEFRGVSPVTFRVSRGEPHAVRVTRRGYLPWRRALGSDAQSSYNIPLQVEPVATLLVSATRPDADVYLDERRVGRTSDRRPLRIEGVDLGVHELRVQCTNYVTFRQQLDVTRAGEVPVYARLKLRQAESIRALLAKEPRSALLYTELGHAYMVNRQFDPAMDAYKEALSLVYSGRDSSRYSGRLKAEVQKIVQGSLFKFGDEDDIRVACEKLEDVFLDLSAEHSRARARLEWLARHYSGRNRHEDAIRLYRKMIRIAPDNLDLYYRVASLALNRKDYETAVQTLRQGLERNAKSWGLHYRLGMAYAARARVDHSASDRRLAIDHLTRARELCRSATDRRNVEYYLKQTEKLDL
jgi:tetratricopeptide (TPR) repeat protein